MHPVTTDTTLSPAENSAQTFSAADFSFSDADGDGLASVTIKSLPANGTRRAIRGPDRPFRRPHR
jgi:hypothetical protein